MHDQREALVAELLRASWGVWELGAALAKLAARTDSRDLRRAGAALHELWRGCQDLSSRALDDRAPLRALPGVIAALDRITRIAAPSDAAHAAAWAL